MNKSSVFLFECNNTRDVSQHLNGEYPYRQNVIDYYVMNCTKISGYEKLMSINAKSDYAHTSKMVLDMKEKVAKDLASKNPGHPVFVLPIDPRNEVPVMNRIQEAIKQYERTGIASRVIRL